VLEARGVHRFPSPPTRGGDSDAARESAIELAEALQRGMLPQTPPRLHSVQVAFRYLPGNDLIQVGGDWFDAMALPGRRVGLVVGDVMGHGVGSAAMMGQLRTAVQTLASLGLPPDELLRHLDEAARRLSDTHLATCMYGIYDPVTRRFTVANAGHLPPALARAGEPGRLLEVPTGVPIGIGGHPFDMVEVDIADGDTLVLYTDGLVENRKREITEGLDELCFALSGETRALEELCDTLIETLGTDQRTDDAALMLARFRGIDTTHVASWSFEPTARAAGQARRVLRRTLRSWNLPHLVDTAELLVTELIGQTLGHAYRPIGLRILHTDKVTFEVHDDGHALPTLRTVEAMSESGRALFVVNSMADRWGTNRTATGKVVWFELSPHAPPQDA
jgi:Stage II sporulation protein E (SpoIIE)